MRTESTDEIGFFLASTTFLHAPESATSRLQIAFYSHPLSPSPPCHGPTLLTLALHIPSTLTPRVAFLQSWSDAVPSEAEPPRTTTLQPYMYLHRGTTCTTTTQHQTLVSSTSSVFPPPNSTLPLVSVLQLELVATTRS